MKIAEIKEVGALSDRNVIPQMGITYREATAEEEVALSKSSQPELQIEELKQRLADMDYKTSKYADGEYAEAEWAEIVAERRAIREQIRQLGG